MILKFVDIVKRRGAHYLPIAILLGLTACAPHGEAQTGARSFTAAQELPAMKTFAGHQRGRILRSNSELARDFLDLSFRIETGKTLSHFSRFEGPITVRVEGQRPATLNRDLTSLINRLRSEARIDISLTSAETASVTVVTKSRAALDREVRGAACFVVPNVAGWDDFKAKRRIGAISWLGVRERTAVSIFLPSDAAPQELRDCLHEELAQAIGPLNDLYRLPDSVFNDDNFNSILTAFDMLMLRATYDPTLKAGMRRSEVGQKISTILRKLNPGGQRSASQSTRNSSTAWTQAIVTALNGRGVQVLRQQAAQEAVNLRSDIGSSDVRDGLSYYALGRLTLYTQPQLALESLQKADAIFATSPSMNIHRAKVAEQMAEYALRHGEAEQVLDIVQPWAKVAMRHENATLLASLMMLRAEALEIMGRPSEAQIVRQDSLGWARYGLGSPTAVMQRLREIQSIRPAGRR